MDSQNAGLFGSALEMGGFVKWVRLENFKSFRGAHLIELGAVGRLSCIVGPNGSGKSNLVDAMSFVLGLQSRQLRSTRLEDLVYRGSTGCKVELGVVPKQGGRVKRFGRVISCGGVGSYRIDDQESTRDRYQRELEATLSVQHEGALVVIAQGEVESLASKSASELGEFVESQIPGSDARKREYEASKRAKQAAEEASISCFKRRKVAAARKKTLKAEKEEAEAWGNKASQLARLKREHAMWQIKFARSKMDAARTELATHRSAMEASLQEDEALVLELDAAKSAYSKLDIKAREWRRAAAEVSDKLASTVEPEIAAHKDLVARGLPALPDEEPARAAAAKVVVAQAQLDAARDAEQRAKDKAGSPPEWLAAVREDEFSALCGLARERSDDAVRTLAHASSASRDARRELGEVEARFQALVAERLSLQEQKENLLASERQHRHDANLAQAVAHLASLRLQEAELAARQAELAVALDQLEDESSSGALTAAAASTAAEERVESLRLLFRGIRGRFVDVCKPTQRKYATAVAAAAGVLADAIVCDTKQCAIDCVRYLRRQRLGSAIFLPLDSLCVDEDELRRLRDSVLLPARRTGSRRPQPYRLAIDCVAYDDEAVAPAVHYALGTAVVCDTLDDARALAYGGGIEGRVVKAVAVAGSVIAKSGAITAGSLTASTKASVQAWRKLDAQERRDLEAELQAARRKWRALALDLLPDAERSAAAVAARANLARAEGSTMESQLNSIESRLTAALQAERHGQIAANMDAKNAAVAAAAAVEAAARSTVRRIHAGVFARLARRIRTDPLSIADYFATRHGGNALSDDLIEPLRRRRRQLEELVAHETIRATEAKSRLALARTERDLAAQRVKTAESKLDELEGTAARLRHMIADAQNHADATRAKLDKAQVDIDAITAKRSTVLQANTAAKRALASTERALEALAADATEVSNKAAVENIPLPRVQVESTTPTQSSTSSSSSSLLSLRVDDVDLSELDADESLLDDEIGFAETQALRRDRAEALEREIAKAAPNMKAAAMYAECAKEVEAIEKELTKVRDNLRDATREFEDAKTKRRDALGACLNVVGDKLNSIYAKLTRSGRHAHGGTASLSAVDPDEPYAGGLAYHATPPSKRFCDIAQLSGGERTLASLTLLFAIHAYANLNFVILDEVDANLDAPNILRLANFLLHTQHQVIAISHKEQLYNAADLFIGIAKNATASSQPFVLDLALRFPTNNDEEQRRQLPASPAGGTSTVPMAGSVTA